MKYKTKATIFTSISIAILLVFASFFLGNNTKQSDSEFFEETAPISVAASSTDDYYDVLLAAIRQQETGSGSLRSTGEEILWNLGYADPQQDSTTRGSIVRVNTAYMASAYVGLSGGMMTAVGSILPPYSRERRNSENPSDWNWMTRVGHSMTSGAQGLATVPSTGITSTGPMELSRTMSYEMINSWSNEEKQRHFSNSDLQIIPFDSYIDPDRDVIYVPQASVDNFIRTDEGSNIVALQLVNSNSQVMETYFQRAGQESPPVGTIERAIYDGSAYNTGARRPIGAGIQHSMLEVGVPLPTETVRYDRGEYESQIDGFLGPNTRDAFKEWVTINGIDLSSDQIDRDFSDGVESFIGSPSWHALNNAHIAEHGSPASLLVPTETIQTSPEFRIQNYGSRVATFIESEGVALTSAPPVSILPSSSEEPLIPVHTNLGTFYATPDGWIDATGASVSDARVENAIQATLGSAIGVLTDISENFPDTGNTFGSRLFDVNADGTPDIAVDISGRYYLVNDQGVAYGDPMTIDQASQVLSNRFMTASADVISATSTLVPPEGTTFTAENNNVYTFRDGNWVTEHGVVVGSLIDDPSFITNSQNELTSQWLRSGSLTLPDSTTTSHVVQSGETLSEIALSYGVSLDDLAAANDIDNVDLILSGTTLVIPTPSTVSAATDNIWGSEAESIDNFNVLVNGEEMTLQEAIDRGLVTVRDDGGIDIPEGVDVAPVNQISSLPDEQPPGQSDALSPSGPESLPQVYTGLEVSTRIGEYTFRNGVLTFEHQDESVEFNLQNTQLSFFGENNLQLNVGGTWVPVDVGLSNDGSLVISTGDTQYVISQTSLGGRHIYQDGQRIAFQDQYGRGVEVNLNGDGFVYMEEGVIRHVIAGDQSSFTANTFLGIRDYAQQVSGARQLGYRFDGVDETVFITQDGTVVSRLNDDGEVIAFRNADGSTLSFNGDEAIFRPSPNANVDYSFRTITAADGFQDDTRFTVYTYDTWVTDGEGSVSVGQPFQRWQIGTDSYESFGILTDDQQGRVVLRNGSPYIVLQSALVSETADYTGPRITEARFGFTGRLTMVDETGATLNDEQELLVRTAMRESLTHSREVRAAAFGIDSRFERAADAAIQFRNAFRNYQGISTAFIGREELERRKRDYQEKMSSLYLERMFTSAICGSIESLPAGTDGGVGLSSPFRGAPTIAMTVNARRSHTFESNNETLYLYKITYFIRNPDNFDDITYNVEVQGRRTVSLYSSDQTVSPGRSSGVTGSDMFIQYSATKYDRVCIILKSTPATITYNRVCNIIVDESTASTTLNIDVPQLDAQGNPVSGPRFNTI